MRGPGRGQVEYTEGTDGFFAILGSPNGACSMRTLIDHKSDIHYRSVERVLVVGESDESKNLDKVGSSRTFIIFLGGERIPQQA